MKVINKTCGQCRCSF